MLNGGLNCDTYTSAFRVANADSPNSGLQVRLASTRGGNGVPCEESFVSFAGGPPASPFPSFGLSDSCGSSPWCESWTAPPQATSLAAFSPT